jgi:hypothetical protein
MRRLAGCLVVSLLASAAAWVGCRDDLGDETLPLLAGSGTDAGVGGDAYGGGGSDDGGGATDDGGGRPDARRGPQIDPIDRTSFYACAGGPASAGVEVGLPIALALAIAVRRRRRWRQAGAPDRAP